MNWGTLCAHLAFDSSSFIRNSNGSAAGTLSCVSFLLARPTNQSERQDRCLGKHPFHKTHIWLADQKFQAPAHIPDSRLLLRSNLLRRPKGAF